MKKHILNILIGLIFLAGLSVLLYPLVSDFFHGRGQDRVISRYVENMETMETPDFEALRQEALDYNASLEIGREPLEVRGEALDAYLGLLDADGEAIGYLDIGKLKVSLPIYLGDSEEILKVGAGTMPGTSLPIGGPGTHSVLTGHRGLPSSKLFSDLDELREGDIFQIHILDRELSYQVDQIRTVLPYELEDLMIQEDRDFCTLVTCTPYGVNSHRLLVRGTRLDAPREEQKQPNQRVTSDAVQLSPAVMSAVAAAAVLVIALVMILRRRRQNRPKFHFDE